MIDIIRKNKRSIPPELFPTKNVPKLTSKFAFTSDTTLMSVLPQKSNEGVVLKRTLHSDKEIPNGAVKQKPKIILEYNRYNSLVDTIDKAVLCYKEKNKLLAFDRVL